MTPPDDELTYFEITRTEVYRVPAKRPQDAWDEFASCQDESEYYDRTAHVTLTNVVTGEDEPFEQD